MTQHTVAVIQAQMGSSRLPSKVMIPLDCEHVLDHDIRRVDSANEVDQVVVATSEQKQDDIITEHANRQDVAVYRGSEDDVLDRMYEAATEHDAEVVIRATADCPLLSPSYIDVAVRKLVNGSFDCVSSHLERTFPIEVTTEALSFTSFKHVAETAKDSNHREHVTPYYYDNPAEFDIYNLTSQEVFNQPLLQDRTDLRLTLDEAADYELFRRIYQNVEYDDIIDLKDAIQYVDNESLSRINDHVIKKPYALR